MINLDLYYANHKSLWLDLKIVTLTVPAIAVLVWEMKISRRGSEARVERQAGKETGFGSKLEVGPPGTVPAGD